MAVADEVKALADKGFTAIAIARALAVSRQRVYQLAKEHDIPLPRGREATPRVITGGVTVGLTTSAAGAVAELLVAADLVARGWNVYQPVVRNRGHDLIVYRGETIITLEVRSAYRAASGKLVFNRPQRDQASDHFALVVAGDPVDYQPALPQDEPALIRRPQ